ncbi:protease inhibitor I42 family protein [Xanthomonas albilineans]|uniref:protease inhibitor I42 family protein n=1 Tax=Xanthomonas albilineans TaxID=29447 RepID=UPI0005F33CC6|nr:protease inhibitor I42 family protein [Xanthomonas albilineans]
MTRSFLLLLLCASGCLSLPAMAAGAVAPGAGVCSDGSIVQVTGNADQPVAKTCLADAIKGFPLKRGQLVAIELHENNSTGMSWALRTLPRSLSLLDVSRRPSSSCGKGEVGCGGSVIFTFKAMNRGNGVVDLIYARPREEQASDSRSVRLEVK